MTWQKTKLNLHVLAANTDLKISIQLPSSAHWYWRKGRFPFTAQRSSAATALLTDKGLSLATVSFGRYLLKSFCTLTMVYTAQCCHQASLQVLSSCWFPHRKEVPSMIKSPGWEERPCRMCLISLLERQLIGITIDNPEIGHYFCTTGPPHIKK